MPEDPSIYTRTMAKVYSQQGHHDRAIEIYHHLLKQHPDQLDLNDGLRLAKRQLRLQRKACARELTALVKEWIELMQKYQLLKKLNCLRETARRRDPR